MHHDLHGVALALMVLVAACSGGAEGESEGTTTTTTATATATAGPTANPTTTTATTAATGSTFLACQDLGYDPCDAWLQDCPEGEKCNAWASDGGSSWNANKCVPVAPDPDGVGEPCTVEGSWTSGVDSCAKGAMCWDVDPDTLEGTCIALCQGDVNACARDPWGCCPGVNMRCTITSVLSLCLPACDPLVQDCDPGEACYPFADEFWCVIPLSRPGAVGEPCAWDGECSPGSFCTPSATYPGCDPKADGCCAPLCSLSAPACPPGTACAPWYVDPPPPYTDLGACVIP